MSSGKDKQFYTPASDKKGHSARIWFRVIPGLLSQFEEILATRKFPYKTVSDMIRHAMARHVDYLNSLNATPTVYAGVNLAMSMLNEEREQAKFKEMLEQMDIVVRDHIADNAPNRASKVILDILNVVDSMPEGYWRDRYAAAIHEKYDAFLKRRAKLWVVRGPDTVEEDGDGEGE
jgi:hypothetical protein